MYHALEDLEVLQRREHVQELQTIALATNAGMGGKESLKQIQEITRAVEVETQPESATPSPVIPLLELMNGN